MIGLSYPSFTGNSANFLKKNEEFNTFLQTNTNSVKKSAFLALYEKKLLPLKTKTAAL